MVGAHEVDAIANQASRSSDIVDLAPIVLVDRTSATNAASARSASARLPCTVALRWRRRPVSWSKATADSDIVAARYVDIVADVRVVQAVDFVSDDLAFAGTMTMTWEVTAVDGGTRVDITADDVPVGICAEDHAEGLASSLANLAEHVER